jgi:isopenicillin-N N-acyltransferase like protein
MRNFREIDLSGTPKERGVMHGEQLRDEIGRALSFYKQIFKLPKKTVLDQAAYFQQIITDFNADYADEIIGIADGSEQDPLWIFALNARTEILALSGKTSVNECTSMCFTGPPILGQTWDWGKPLESLCVVMRIIRPDGHEIRMLTEPGIIGKIGMNNAGLGVCLNILTLGEHLDGVPIHVMLRAILDCRSSEQASATINRSPHGKSSNIIVADKSGACFDLEFAGDETLSPASLNGCYAHTNHYLGKEINALDDPLFFNSRTRMDRATQLISQTGEHTAANMMAVLSDRAAEFPIYRPYLPDEVLQDVGTVATIVMDLPRQEFHIRKGNDVAAPFTKIT